MSVGRFLEKIVRNYFFFSDFLPHSRAGFNDVLCG